MLETVTLIAAAAGAIALGARMVGEFRRNRRIQRRLFAYAGR